MAQRKQFIAIDLKSFYASVEAAEQSDQTPEAVAKRRAYVMTHFNELTGGNYSHENVYSPGGLFYLSTRALYFSPNSSMDLMIGRMFSPSSLRAYSTRGGTSG